MTTMMSKIVVTTLCIWISIIGVSAQRLDYQKLMSTPKATLDNMKVAKSLPKPEDEKSALCRYLNCYQGPVKRIDHKYYDKGDPYIRSVHGYYPGGQIKYDSSYTFKKLDDAVIYYYDSRGKLNYSNSKSHLNVYETDERGRIKKIERYYQPVTPAGAKYSSTETYAYNDDGDIVAYRIKGTGLLNDSLSYQYNEKHQPLSVTKFDQGLKVEETIYHYDAKRLILSGQKQWINSYVKIIERKFLYSRKGLKQEETLIQKLTENGIPKNESIYLYKFFYENGLNTRIDTSWPTNPEGQQFGQRTLIEYDKFKNWISKTSFSKENVILGKEERHIQYYE